jgi:hypothetical protein
MYNYIKKSEVIMPFYNTVLFDADGTLLDFKAAERNALEETLQSVGIEPTDELTLIYSAINEGTRKGYGEFFLRKSIVADPLFDRKNTKDNTPAIINLASGIVAHTFSNAFIVNKCPLRSDIEPITKRVLSSGFEFKVR